MDAIKETSIHSLEEDFIPHDDVTIIVVKKRSREADALLNNLPDVTVRNFS